MLHGFCTIKARRGSSCEEEEKIQAHDQTLGGGGALDLGRYNTAAPRVVQDPWTSSEFLVKLVSPVH